MIGRMIEFSARNAFVIVLMLVAVIGGGLWAIVNTPLDAIPDLSDVQVIVSTQWEDRSPNIVEDQVTYPIVTQLLSAPKVKAVRANSFYGESLIYVIFEDGTDPYWARRCSEPHLPCRPCRGADQKQRNKKCDCRDQNIAGGAVQNSGHDLTGRSISP